MSPVQPVLPSLPPAPAAGAVRVRGAARREPDAGAAAFLLALSPAPPALAPQPAGVTPTAAAAGTDVPVARGPEADDRAPVLPVPSPSPVVVPAPSPAMVALQRPSGRAAPAVVTRPAFDAGPRLAGDVPTAPATADAAGARRRAGDGEESPGARDLADPSGALPVASRGPTTPRPDVAPVRPIPAETVVPAAPAAPAAPAVAPPSAVAPVAGPTVVAAVASPVPPPAAAPAREVRAGTAEARDVEAPVARRGARVPAPATATGTARRPEADPGESGGHRRAVSSRRAHESSGRGADERAVPTAAGADPAPPVVVPAAPAVRVTGAAGVEAPAGAVAARPVQPPPAPPAPAGRVTVSFSTEDGLEGRLRVALRGHLVRATIVTDDPARARELESGLNDLRGALGERGFPDARVAVQGAADVRSGETRPGADGRHARQQEEDAGHPHGRRGGEFDSSADDPHRRSSRRRTER